MDAKSHSSASRQFDEKYDSDSGLGSEERNRSTHERSASHHRGRDSGMEKGPLTEGIERSRRVAKRICRSSAP